MEHQICLSILFPFLLFAFMVFRICKKSEHGNKDLNLPPGPRKLPVIGNLHQLAASTLPHRCFRDLAEKYGPVMHLQLAEVSNVVISSSEAAKEVMKTHDLIFAQRPLLLSASIIPYNATDVAFAQYGEYWRQLKKICIVELLSATRVRSFKSIREEEVSILLRSISSSAGSPINFSRMFNALTYSIASRAAFGKVFNGLEAFLPVVRKIIEAVAGFSLADVYPSIKFLQLGIRRKLELLHLEADKILENIINDHKARKAAASSAAGDEEDDLVDVLLNLQQEGNLEFPLTIENIKAVILNMFIGGSDTSSVTVEWGMSEMLKNPRVLEKAQAEVRHVFGRKGNVDEADLRELSYLKLVIKEALRMHPPLPLLLPREARQDCKINGYDIPVRSRVIINAWAIARDPKYWNEPDRFYPERFLDSSLDYKGTDFEFTPFGAGRRMCPGMHFGLANIELPLANLLYHFDWKLPDGLKPEDLDMTEAFGAVVKRKNDLCVIPAPYLPSSAN